MGDKEGRGRVGGRGDGFKQAFLDALASGSETMGIPISEEAAGLFFLYAQRLLEANERTNLTAIKTPEEVAVKHFLDSLSVVKAGQALKGAWVDVGAGAGFPGMVLSLYDPEVEMVLLDASRKRATFMEGLVQSFRFQQTTVEHMRAEDAGRQATYREYFDTAVARAVARLDVLAELCLPLVRPGGRMVAWKGPNAEKELAAAERAIAELGGTQTEVWRETLPFGMGQRRFVVVTKGKATPDRYPRRAGTPERRPLSEYT